MWLGISRCFGSFHALWFYRKLDNERGREHTILSVIKLDHLMFIGKIKLLAKKYKLTLLFVEHYHGIGWVLYRSMKGKQNLYDLEYN